MDDEQLGKSIVARINEDRKGHRDGDLYLFPETMGLLGRAARELLAKPVATREAIKEALRPMWLTQDPHSVRTLDMWVSAAAYALSRFAPPRQRMMIEGMGFDELNKEMHQAYKVAVMGDGAQLANALSICAATAHRLATTPAPEVDADAGALAWLQTPAGAKAAWARLTSDQKAQVRAFAAMEKGNG